MKKTRLILLSVLLILLILFLPISEILASGNTGSVTTYFDWYPGWKKHSTSVSSADTFQVQQGNYRITGQPEFKDKGERLLQYLIEKERELSEQYHLSPGIQTLTIPLVPLDSMKDSDQKSLLQSTVGSELIFLFPVMTDTAPQDPAHRFARFRLLQALISANLAFGGKDRFPISAHAFRFVDGLSGFLALEATTLSEERERFLAILTAEQRRKEVSRRFSTQQLLDRNANSEDTGMMAGLNQFFSGIGLTRNSEEAINPADSSSTADRIRLFQWVHTNQGPEAIRDIIGLLSRNSDLWAIEEEAEDSFCREYIRFGCRERTIDGTRSDIILQHVTGLNFAQLLHRSRRKGKIEDSDEIPPYPVYAFDYPKAGGANENLIGIHLKHENTTIDAGDILDSEQITTNGFSLELGIRDEAYRVQAQVDYSTGSKKDKERLSINSTLQSVPRTITSTDLQIGSRILKSGFHSGWADEIGVFFHWKRLQVEWDTRSTVGGKTEREYINSGFFLLDIQKATLWQPSRMLALGLNTDFQLGLVNQSGSVKVVRDEKYNADTSNPVLGISLGPEIRFNISPLLLDIRIGGAAEFLWQPLDDKGGKSGGENDINASQSRIQLFATVGLLF